MPLSIYCAKDTGSLRYIPPLEFAISDSLDDQALSAVIDWYEPEGRKEKEENGQKKKDNVIMYVELQYLVIYI